MLPSDLVAVNVVPERVIVFIASLFGALPSWRAFPCAADKLAVVLLVVRLFIQSLHVFVSCCVNVNVLLSDLVAVNVVPERVIVFIASDLGALFPIAVLRLLVAPLNVDNGVYLPKSLLSIHWIPRTS